MAVTSSGEIKLIGDVNNEVNGNTTDTNVSLTTLSTGVGKDAPHGLTEFYGWAPPSWQTFGTYNKQGGSNHNNGSGEDGWFTLTNSGSLSNTTISSTKWRLKGTADSGAVSNEYWWGLYIENSAGTQLDGDDVSSMSLTYPCYQYHNAPANAWNNEASGYFWSTGGNCDHTNSIVELTFSSSQTINKFWLGTWYTKVSQMALQYWG